MCIPVHLIEQNSKCSIRPHADNAHQQITIYLMIHKFKVVCIIKVLSFDTHDLYLTYILFNVYSQGYPQKVCNSSYKLCMVLIPVISVNAKCYRQDFRILHPAL